jgi:hypothetical protein
MATNTEKVTLGSGQLILNGIDVGHLKGTVSFEYTVERVGFKPANMLGDVKMFKVRANCVLRAQSAELKVANLKLAMGLTTSVDGSTSFPLYVGDGDACSYDVPAAESYDVLTFGGNKATDEMCLRFMHTRPDSSDTFHIVLYKAVCDGELNVPFIEDDITLYELAFRGLADEDRTAGDQIGVLVEQVAE